MQVAIIRVEREKENRKGKGSNQHEVLAFILITPFAPQPEISSFHERHIHPIFLALKKSEHCESSKFQKFCSVVREA